VVDHLIGTPDDRDLKCAILHLAAAIEGFVKARLPPCASVADLH
jgi:hypothetical protein